jgi:hypothetical protein
MQSMTMFYCDPRANDFDRATSLLVIEDITQYNRNFFETEAPEGHPGLKAVRLARAPDGKLSCDDIVAWDDLVVRHLLPAFDQEEAQLLAAFDPDDPQKDLYQQAIEMCRERKATVVRLHQTFMMAYRPFLEATRNASA